MLNLLRKNTKIIIWLVVIAFAAGGGIIFGTSFSSKENRMAGEVFGKPVTFQDFRTFYHGARITGEPINDPQLLHQKTWQNIVYSREAKKLKIDVTDEEVKRELSVLLKQVGLENASADVYEQWLERTFKLNTRAFEDQIRELIRIRKLVTSVLNAPSEVVSEEKVKQKFALENTLIKAESVYFETKEDAEQFRGTLNEDITVWSNAMGNDEIPSEAPEQVSLLDLAMANQMTVANAEKLGASKSGDFSDVIPTTRGFAVFRVINKVEPDYSKLDGELTQKYMKELQTNEKQIRFYVWTQDLLKRADVKDYVASGQQ